jgi:hypothetical protein
VPQRVLGPNSAASPSSIGSRSAETPCAASPASRSSGPAFASTTWRFTRRAPRAGPACPASRCSTATAPSCATRRPARSAISRSYNGPIGKPPTGSMMRSSRSCSPAIPTRSTGARHDAARPFRRSGKVGRLAQRTARKQAHEGPLWPRRQGQGRRPRDLGNARRGRGRLPVASSTAGAAGSASSSATSEVISTSPASIWIRASPKAGSPRGPHRSSSSSTAMARSAPRAAG